jgi:aminomethyltransferase
MACSIALARVNKPVQKNLVVEIRGKRLPVDVVKPNFVRHGQIVSKPL